MAQMSLYRYCRPADSVLDRNGRLTHTIAPNVLSEVNKEMKLVAAGKKKKRGSYLSFTPEEKARVAQYGSVNGVRAAVRRFSICKHMAEGPSQYHARVRLRTSYSPGHAL